MARLKKVITEPDPLLTPDIVVPMSEPIEPEPNPEPEPVEPEKPNPEEPNPEEPNPELPILDYHTDEVLKAFSNYRELYVDSKGGAYTVETDPRIRKEAILYQNPYNQTKP